MAFAELKARQSVVWGNGPYERITNTIRDIHALVIELMPFVTPGPAVSATTPTRRVTFAHASAANAALCS